MKSLMNAECEMPGLFTFLLAGALTFFGDLLSCMAVTREG